MFFFFYSSCSHGMLTGFSLHSDGGGHKSLTLGYDGEERKLGDKYAVTRGSYGSLGMEGREVYKFATREVRTGKHVALGGGRVMMSMYACPPECLDHGPCVQRP